jgi:lipoic acid synthetase
MDDLLEAGCEVLTVGQYLRPSVHHAPVARFMEPAEFDRVAQFALQRGFLAVASGPLVRSSYRAADLFARAAQARLRRA